uniref:Metalloendopeptidase n=1 Tax=Cuerna arida TaxID=1464854 RepID=A0A1B6F4X2_9HEMI
MLFLLLFLVGVSFCSSRSLGVSEENNKDYNESPDFSFDEERSATKEAAAWTDEWHPDPEQNIWELSGLFEGDIIEDDENSPSRNGLLNISSRWPGGVVPFEISSKYDNTERDVIFGAMNEIENRTCISFRPRTTMDADYLMIRENKPGCSSFVGRKGNGQLLNLSRPRCIRHGPIVHELLHTLGLHHQHSATDRDQHIQINWQNIQLNHKRDFKKFNSSQTSSYGVPYDYSSIMHYSKYAFSRNGNPTITPLIRGVQIGQRRHLSEGDATKINLMYDCDTSTEDGAYDLNKIK